MHNNRNYNKNITMNLHEFQGKSILKKYGVAVPVGYCAESPVTAVEVASNITKETGSSGSQVLRVTGVNNDAAGQTLLTIGQWRQK